MDAKELRIGNLLAHKGNVYTVKKSHFVGAKIDFSDPIPLTEDWMRKFGFEEDKNHDEDDNGNFVSSWGLRIDADGINCRCFWLFYNKMEGNIYIQIDGFDEISGLKLYHAKHVHELQNLYHALTGNELKIK